MGNREMFMFRRGKETKKKGQWRVIDVDRYSTHVVACREVSCPEGKASPAAGALCQNECCHSRRPAHATLYATLLAAAFVPSRGRETHPVDTVAVSLPSGPGHSKAKGSETYAQEVVAAGALTVEGTRAVVVKWDPRRRPIRSVIKP